MAKPSSRGNPTVKQYAGDINKRVSERIRAHRERKGLNQAALAEVLGVRIQQVSRYEVGESVWQVWQIFAVARALQIDPMVLLTDVDRHSPIEDPTLTRRQARMIRILDDLDPEIRQKLESSIDTMLSAVRDATSKP